MRADWRLADGDWAPMPRGVGWLEQAELSQGQDFGSLQEGDLRGAAEAVCELPEGWRAVLGTEQRGKNGERAIVAFIDVRSCPRPA